MSIDTTQIRYELVAVTPQGNLFLGDSLKGLSWEEQPDELAVRLTADVLNSQTKIGWLHKALALGGHLVLFSDWGEGVQELWRGMEWTWSYNSGLNTVSLTAYDMLIQLAKSEDDRLYFDGTTAVEIIKDIANSWGIPLGRVNGPNIKLPKQIFRAKKVSQIINEVLKSVEARGGGKWIVRANAGKIDVIQRGANNPIYHITGQDIVSDVDDVMDLGDIVTQVKVVGAKDDDQRSPVEHLENGLTEYGIFRKVLYDEQFEDVGTATAAAKQIIATEGKPQRTIKVKARDLPFVRRGDKIRITAGTLDNYCLVNGVSHNPDNLTMTMEVKIVG